MIRALLLLALLAPLSTFAGPFSNQLRTDPPQSGRVIDESGNTFNTATDARCSPLNIARGKCTGAIPMASYGERTTAGAESGFPVWPDGAITFASAFGVQMSIASTSANDTAGGANVRKVEVHYLDRQLDAHEETVTLAGLTPVLTAATDIRWIQCMHIVETGATAVAAGNITATNGGNTYSYIAAGDTRCSSSFRMVPRGKYLYVDGAVGGSISVTADTTTRLRLVATEIDDHQYLQNPILLLPIAAVGVQNTPVAFQFPPGIRYRPGTLVGCTHTTNKAATVTCSWFGRLEPIDGVQ